MIRWEDVCSILYIIWHKHAVHNLGDLLHSKKWARMNNLLQVDENSMEQYFAANIVLGF